MQVKMEVGGGSGGGKTGELSKYTISSATASSTLSTYTVDKSYDDSLATYWAGASGTYPFTHYAIYDLGSQKEVNAINIIFGTASAVNNTVAVKIQGSTDGSSFDDIIITSAFTVNNAWNAQAAIGDTKHKMFAINKSYRYWKISLTTSAGTENKYSVGIGEIEFYGIS